MSSSAESCPGIHRLVMGLILMLLSAGCISAESPQRIYPVGHKVYRCLEAAYRDAGRVLPEVVYPANGAQLRLYLDLLADARLSVSGEYYRSEAQCILNGTDGPGPVLHEPSRGFSLEFDPQFALEYRLDDPSLDTRLLDPPVDLLRLDSRIAMGSVYGEIQFVVRQEPYHGELAPANPTNVPSALTYIDVNFPPRAFAALGGDTWLFQVGRDRVVWGASRSGSLTLSGDPDYLEFARFSTFFRTFSYSWIFFRLEPYVQSWDELPDDGPYVPPFFLDDGSGGIAGPSAHYRVWRKSIVMHRFTFRPGERVRFSVMESTGIGGYAPDLRILNPFMILHNHFDFSLMTFACSAELTVTPLGGLELYGQWYMNDFLLPQEADAGSTEPNAMAWLTGVHWQHPLDLLTGSGPTRAAVLLLGGEFYYGDPYVYIRESVLRSFTYRHRVYTNYDGSGGETLGRIVWQDGFLGSPFGNDSLAWLVFAGLELAPTGRLELELVRYQAGELGPTDILTPSTEAAQQQTPTGTPEYATQFTTELRVSSDGIPGLSWNGFVLDAAVTGRLLWTANLDHHASQEDFQAALGLSIGARWRN